jgi:hypothetical protein
MERAVFFLRHQHILHVCITLPRQVQCRVQLSFKCVAKRLALVALSSSEQEYEVKYKDGGISEMYEKESLKLPCAKYVGETLIQKRFALLHRSHVYHHLMKVFEPALAIFACARSQ